METKFKIPTGRAKTNPGVDGQHLFGVVCGAEGGKDLTDPTGQSPFRVRSALAFIFPSIF